MRREGGGRMTLTLADAAEILTELGQGAPWVRHCEAVSRVAAALARALAQVLPVDVAFTARAGLLHDIGRCRSHHPIHHGVEGYRLLSALGHAAEARVCLGHLLHAFDPADAPELRLDREAHLPSSWEERLIPLADFLVEGDRPTTLEARFASLRRRYADNAVFLERFAASEAWTREAVQQLENLLSTSAETLAAAAWTSG